MSFNAEHIRCLVVRPTLSFLDMHSPAAEELMLGTMAHESIMGKYCRQVGGGPALGFWQVEPNTEADNWDNWLKYRPEIAAKVRVLMRLAPEADNQLVTNAQYSCAHGRIKLWRAKPPLPLSNDTPGLAQYWKNFYNTNKGAGTPEQWIKHYNEFVLGE